MTTGDILCPFGTFCVHLVHFVFIWNILCSSGTFCVHLEHFVFIWNILCSFGTFCVHLVHFIRFRYHAPRNIWQPCVPHFLFAALSTYDTTRTSCKKTVGHHVTPPWSEIRENPFFGFFPLILFKSVVDLVTQDEEGRMNAT
jgi:hypothetical protein